MSSASPPAVLALADGTVYPGISIGAAGQTVGEVVFNTSMTGYQEILTDPSYRRQIVTLTYPHIGSTGVNAEDVESDRIQAAGLVVRDVPRRMSNFRAERTLGQYLRDEGVVAIAGLDTRALTRRLRTLGAQNGAIVAAEPGATLGADARERAVELARAAPSMVGLDLAREVGRREPAEWRETEWRLGSGHGRLDAAAARRHVVVVDFGVKRNILRMLAGRGCRLTLVPPTSAADAILALRPDGVLLANGPGDPAACAEAIAAARALIDARVPVFGICLGHQILALALGATTHKMKFGHHGANHPVRDLDSGRVAITSQNHGFAVDAATLPPGVRATHASLFDGSLQGLACDDRPVFSFQGHPEASPGPRDLDPLFDRFVAAIDAAGPRTAARERDAATA